MSTFVSHEQYKDPTVEVVSGEFLTATEAGARYGKVSRRTIVARINAGWIPLHAVLLPHVNNSVAKKFNLPYIHKASKRRPVDNIGKVFKGLKIIAQLPNDKFGHHFWQYECIVCGAIGSIGSSGLNRRNSDNCLECQVVDYAAIKKLNKKINNTYQNMIRRCTDSKAPNYHNYGGRGITVCEEWLSSIENFRSWVLSIEDHYNLLMHRHYQLDRLNNDGNYCPENCKFVSRHANMKNRRNTILIEVVPGEFLTIKEAADKYSLLDYDTVRRRISKGVMTPLEAIFLPDISWTTIHKLRLQDPPFLRSS